MVVMEAMRSMICSRLSPVVGFVVRCMTKQRMTMLIVIYKIKKIAGWPARLTFLSCTQQIEAPDFPLADRAAAALESGKRLEIAMESLSPRLRLVAEGIRDGKSYSEIGSMLGVSKQAAHKLAGAAVAALRDRLEAMGFQGLDTLGLLKSGCGVSPQSVVGGVSPPAFPPPS
jgi:DNA-directed RNA polymerase specialized sigma24 family protein